MPRKTDQGNIGVRAGFPFPVTRTVSDWIFGEPSLFVQGISKAEWARAERTSLLATDQKSTTGWLAKLYGGTQSDYGDGAALYIPVNEMPLPKLTSAQWTYWMENGELFGCQIQIWVHDPTDNRRRADIIQSGAAIGLSHKASWNGHILNRDTGVQFFWFGEDDGSALSGSDLTTGSTNLTSLAAFQSDVLFKNWTIYRISLNNGFYNAGHFGDMYIADVKINGQVIPLKPSIEEQLDMARDDVAKAQRVIPTWTFGQPTLQSGGVGAAEWTHDVTKAQKGTTGWQAKLTGGDQTDSTVGTNWASMYVPVNEVPIPEFNSALWSYYLTNGEEYGFNIVIWAHDPADNGRRVEITQGGSAAGLDRAQYWNGHVLDTTAVQFFWFGEDYGEVHPHTLDGSGITAGALSSWDAFQADALFSGWTIYRVSIDYGWYSAGTFEAGWLAELKLNGQVIPLKPDLETQLETMETSVVTAVEAIVTPPTSVTDASDTTEAGATLYSGAAKLYWFMFSKSTAGVGNCKILDGTSGSTADFTIYAAGETSVTMYLNPPLQFAAGIRNGGMSADSELLIGYVAD